MVIALNSSSVIDPEASARLAGLVYICDDEPGIRRRRSGQGFSYITATGQVISDPAERKRCEALVIPPAWTDVWISPDPQGHIQATGRDAKGRRQYVYHPLWEQIRNQTKFSRMVTFGEALPPLNERIERDLKRHTLSREKVLAIVVKLLEETLIRVGNAEYAQANKTFGLTTLRNRHVAVSGEWVRFEFIGKSGKRHTVDIRNRRLARQVKACQQLPGYHLFQYIDEEGKRQQISSGDVNQYLREITGEHFSAKDFRTWGGSVQAVLAFADLGPPESEKEAQKNIVKVIKTVAQRLGNTPAVCRKYYVHPAVVAAYENGSLLEIGRQKVQQASKERASVESEFGLRWEEEVLLEILLTSAGHSFI
ncbi:MAG: DNA topoisomerase IB [Chloroflexi bacterium]|nr:DNA topoisomerase IB [Chloroflexota bacterium]